MKRESVLTITCLVIVLFANRPGMLRAYSPAAMDSHAELAFIPQCPDTGRPPPCTTPAPSNVKRRTGSSTNRNASRASREQAEREQAERERVEREQAERDAARQRAARQRVETMRSEGGATPQKVSWLVATLVNSTQGPIPYQLQLREGWKEFTLPAGHQIVHTMLYQDKILIKYDARYDEGYQEKQYWLGVKNVVGHEPTDAEKQQAPVSFFLVDASNEIKLEGNVWSMSMLINKTAGPIPYQLLLNGTWTEFTLPAGHQVVHTAFNVSELSIRYDYKYDEGYQLKQYKLFTTPVVGHEPNEFEKLKAGITFFELDANGDIEMHHQPG